MYEIIQQPILPPINTGITTVLTPTILMLVVELIVSVGLMMRIVWAVNLIWLISVGLEALVFGH